MKHWLQNAGRVLTSPRMAAAYARWQWDRVIGRTHEVKLRHNVKVRGFRQFSEYWSFQPPSSAELRLIERVAQTGIVFVDIGANLGSFTLFLSRCAPQAKIYSFEPAPSTFRLLEENIRLNGLSNVLPQMMAVCDHGGMVDFTDAEFGSQNNSLISASFLKDAPIVKVPATTIDEFCETNNIRSLDFLKIDTEGAETLVLRGATKMFRQRAIKLGLIEFSSYWLKSAGTTAAALAGIIRESGYELFSLSQEGTPGRKLPDHELAQIVLDNVLLLPNP